LPPRVIFAKQKLTQRVCNEPVMRDDFLKKGITLRYSYFDKDKQPIASVGRNARRLWLLVLHRAKHFLAARLTI
jgi:hypothetical protein